MLEYYFDDIGVLRYIIGMLNYAIETYGQVDVSYVKELMELDYKPKFTDSCFGWTEGFVEKRDVQPVMRGVKWTFKFTLSEPKELK